MSYYIIGIGGTGAKCLESFTHLCSAGLLKDTQPVKMVFVDADVSCGNLTRTQETVKRYNEAKKIGFGKSGLFKNSIDAFEPWTPVPAGCSNMDDVFQRTSLINKNETKPLGYLYDSLFTEQERTTALDKGFRGHPAIGAAVMSQAIDVEAMEPWKTLIQQINIDKDPRVFFFASVFGGTGAAGFPTIAKLIHQVVKKNPDGTSIAKFGGALLLPYFQFPSAPTEEEGELQAKVSEFMLNTKSALDYYDKSGLVGSVFNSIYLLGDCDLTEVKEFSLGSNTQKNAANFVEIYAALAAFDFFKKENFDTVSTPMISRGDNSPDSKDKVTWEDLPNACANGDLRAKLGNFIKFLYVYKNCVFKNLEKCAMNQSAQKTVAWYKDLVENAGKIDLYHDKKVMDEFKDLGIYADNFFSWFNDIINNPKRKIELINKQACSSNVLDKLFTLDAYQIVLPVTNRKDRLTGVEFWKKLCDYSSENHITSDSGAEILMSAVYEICSK